eukprot:tig00020710_g13365.t1
MAPSQPAETLAAGGSPLRFRKVREDEVDKLSSFTCRAFEEFEAHILRTPKLLPEDVRAHWAQGEFLVCESAATEAGASAPTWFSTCYIQKAGSDIWLRYLAVPPEHRKRGLARAMIEHVESLGRSRGCSHIKLVIAEIRSPDLQPLYERLGFAYTGATQVADIPARLQFPVKLLEMSKAL